MTTIRYTSFRAVLGRVGEFLEYLSSSNVRIHHASVHSQAAEGARLAFAFHQTGMVPATLDTHGVLSDLANVGTLADAVLDARCTPFEVKLRTKLRDLGRGDPRQLTPGRHSKARASIFELLR